MANGMTGLYIGASGLQSAQAGLNTTAHNLSNINTTGYTRQQITYCTNEYFTIGSTATTTKQYGIGVAVQEIRRVRDEFIDAAYRQENGRLGYYSSQYDAVTEVESQFGELDGVAFSKTLTELYSSISELAKDPTNTVTRSSLMQYATAFMDRADSIYDGLVSYQQTLNTKVSNMVSRINTLGDTIASLNSQIQAVEVTGQTANDLRDERDSALDELSGYVKIQYDQDEHGSVSVSVEGISFVQGKDVTKMGTELVEGTTLITPTWPALEGRTVFNETEKITTISNNDIGELKGLILARGSKAVDHTDVPVEPDQADYDMTNATEAAQYATDYAKYEKNCDYYNAYIDPSVILSTIAGFDKLINGVVTAINEVLCPETTATFTGTDGKTYTDVTVLNTDATGYGMDEDKTVGEELFSRKYTDRYTEVTGTDGKTYHVKNETNSLGNASDYTLGNLEINPTVLQYIDKIPLSTAQGKADMDRAKALVDTWSDKFAALNPSTYSKEDFVSFYNSLVGEFADSGSVLDNYVSNQQTMVDGYDNQRLQTEGVSSDEELQNMIKFQQAYNASSRYINVVSEMLEHIITKLGS